MKRIGYWFIAYGIVLLSIAFLWNFLVIEKEQDIPTSVKAKEYNEVKFISGGITGTAVEADALVSGQANYPTEAPIGNMDQKEAEKKVTVKKTTVKKTTKKSAKKSKKSTKKKRTTQKNKKSNSKTKKSSKKIERMSPGNIKDSELNILERIVQAEAGGEDEKGRILVANVILNRVATKKRFPNTIKGVVFAYEDGYYQFSPVMDGRFYSAKVSKSTKRAVKKALSGVDYSYGALYFMNRRSASSKNVRWFDTHLKYILKHGRHEFFR